MTLHALVRWVRDNKAELTIRPHDFGNGRLGAELYVGLVHGEVKYNFRLVMSKAELVSPYALTDLYFEQKLMELERAKTGAANAPKDHTTPDHRSQA